MDPVSHALFGRLIAGFDRRVSLGPGSRAAFVLGALAPDLDILLVPRGWDVYLNAHQAWTHSLALSPVVGLLVAGVVRLVSKSAKLDRVWIAAWIGVVAGHLLFDLVSGSDMQLFWPVLSTRFSPHLLAMSDWLAVGIVVLATAASYRRRWLAAWLTVAAMVLLLSVKAGSQSLARRAFEASVAGEQDEVASARPDAVSGLPFEWVFYDRQGRAVRAWRVNARTARTELLFSLNATGDEAAVAASRAVPGSRDVPETRARAVSDARDSWRPHARSLVGSALLPDRRLRRGVWRRDRRRQHAPRPGDSNRYLRANEAAVARVGSVAELSGGRRPADETSAPGASVDDEVCKRSAATGCQLHDLKAERREA